MIFFLAVFTPPSGPVVSFPRAASACAAGLTSPVARPVALSGGPKDLLQLFVFRLFFEQFIWRSVENDGKFEPQASVPNPR
jgi:hypothetical protein